MISHTDLDASDHTAPDALSPGASAVPAEELEGVQTEGQRAVVRCQEEGDRPPLPSPDADALSVFPAEMSWQSPIVRLWNQTGALLKKWLPVEQTAQTVADWFRVSDAQVAEILATVRSQLPTTEAILIGKPQAGKSSIVRALTGVSAEIVGQGFRPHTQHTQRYAYPSEELPLLIFTDTVGLGDVNRETAGIIDELMGNLDQNSGCARILILTVKITDFATDTLRQVAQQLRQQYPSIPCLLAVTCLHELYPVEMADHPAYPPDVADIQRAFAALQQTFQGLYDQAVLVDFTLEEDGYTPVYYGFDAFREAIAALLPAAEARAIHQLLDQQAGDQIGNLYRDVGRRYSLAFAIMAGAIAALPLPFATMPVLTTLQVSLVTLLGQLYGQVLTPSQAGGVVSAIAGGFLAQAIGRELLKFIPVLGSVIAASWAAAYTWALGEGACVYFGDLMGGKKPNVSRIQTVMREAFKAGQERFKGIQS